VLSVIVIAVFIFGIFAVDIVMRWWRENEWRRRWRDGDEE
jgi:hypothetical protein